MKIEYKKTHNHELFLLPGLGVDTRIYDRLLTQLPFNIIRAEWLVPRQNETLSDYAKRTWLHHNGHEGCIVIGMSFGGIVAQEIAQQYNSSGLILISTLTKDVEKSFPLRIMKYVPYYRLLKGTWRIQAVRYGGGLAGITQKADREFLADMLTQQPSVHRMWGYRQIAHWKPSPLPDIPVIRFHGTHDKVFPLTKADRATMIPGGTHFMLHQRAEELADPIHRFIQLL